METKDILIQRYGVLLSLSDLAEVLQRSPGGLRIGLSGNTEFAVTWRTAKRKIGRRLYFSATDVARLIDAGLSR